MIENQFANHRSWFLVASSVAFLAVLGFSLYFGLKTSQLKANLQTLERQKETLMAEAQNNENKNTTSVALNIKDQLQQIERNQLPWSRIIEKIENTIPKPRDSNVPIVSFQSYNGNEDGKIAVSAVTRSESADGFTDIALLIRTFVAEPLFKNVFVPSITKSMTSNGETVLSFSLTFDYQKTPF